MIEADTKTAGTGRSRILNIIIRYRTVLILLVLMAVFSSLKPIFLHPLNLLAILKNTKANVWDGIIGRKGTKRNDPESWASSQVEEGIPQLARYLFLRQAWGCVVREDDPSFRS